MSLVECSVVRAGEISRIRVEEWANEPGVQRHVLFQLFGCDRLSCCDEGVVAKFDNTIVGMASIAPLGEANSGTPTIVGVYVLPRYRGQGISLGLMRATVERCRERGFQKVHIDVYSGKLMRSIRKLPNDLRVLLEVNCEDETYEIEL